MRSPILFIVLLLIGYLFLVQGSIDPRRNEIEIIRETNRFLRELNDGGFELTGRFTSATGAKVDQGEGAHMMSYLKFENKNTGEVKYGKMDLVEAKNTREAGIQLSERGEDGVWFVGEAGGFDGVNPDMRDIQALRVFIEESRYIKYQEQVHDCVTYIESFNEQFGDGGTINDFKAYKGMQKYLTGRKEVRDMILENKRLRAEYDDLQELERLGELTELFI